MRARRVALALAAVGLVAGCGLPTPGGVRSAGTIATDQRSRDIQVLPADPQPGATAAEVLRGFLVAQASPDDDFAVARRFLTGDALASWDPAAGVAVLAAQPSVDLPEPGEGLSTVPAVLRSVVIGSVGADGWSQRLPPTPKDLDYDLVRQDGSWRISRVGPAGLTLTPSARDQALRPVTAFYLSAGPGQSRLVPDLVRVPLDEELARHLVEQVVQVGPSDGLGASGRTAVPQGARVLSVRQVGGSVTVDLSAPVLDLADQARQDLSAQLLWTLRQGLGNDFSDLRLLVDGTPLQVAGDDAPQGRNRWDELDPTASDERVSALAVGTGGRALSIGPDDETSLVLDGGQGEVRELVQQPGGRQVAVLTGDGSERRLLVGLPQGTLTTVAADEPLISPTWGNGAFGVWVLRVGADPAIVTVDPTAPAGSRQRQVPVEGDLRLGSTSVLRVSPDGARVALIDASGTLQVGRVEVEQGRPRIVGLAPFLVVNETQTAVGEESFRDVTWTAGAGDVEGVTLLAVRARTSEELTKPLVQLAIDGVDQAQSTLNTGNDLAARQVSARGDQVLEASFLDTGRWQLYRRSGSAYVPIAGADVSYPRFPG